MTIGRRRHPRPITVIAEGTPYAEVEAAWGDSADLVASVSRTDAAWGSATGEAIGHGRAVHDRA